MEWGHGVKGVNTFTYLKPWTTCGHERVRPRRGRGDLDHRFPYHPPGSSGFSARYPGPTPRHYPRLPLSGRYIPVPPLR